MSSSGTKLGIQEAIKLLQSLDGPHREKLLKNVALANPELAQTLTEHLFRFEDVLTLEPKEFQKWYEKISKPTLTLALRGVSEEFWTYLSQNLTKRAFEILKEDVQAIGPRRSSEIEAARKELIESLKTIKG